MDDWRYVATMCGQQSAIEANMKTITLPQLCANNLALPILHLVSKINIHLLQYHAILRMYMHAV